MASRRPATTKILRPLTTATPPPGDDGDPPPPDDGDPPPASSYDFDGDGFADLLVREQSGGIALWRMAGSALLASAPLADDPGWDVVGSGDYDGNGSADLLWEDAASGDRNVWLLRDGTLDAEHTLDLADLAPVDEWRVGGSGDFDGDGRDDVVLFSRILGECEILFMREGSAVERQRLPGYRGAWSIDASDDVDGDGVDEIVWRDEASHGLVLWDMDARGAAVLLAEQVTGWRVIGTGDYDGDGRSDLFAEHAGTQAAQVWIQDGSSIAGIVDLPSPGSGRTATHVGDYDFDGRADLVWSDATSGDVESWFSDDGNGVTAER